MPSYYYRHDAATFTGEFIPAFAACWRARSFSPGRAFFARLTVAADEYARRYHTGPAQPLCATAGLGLLFRPERWRHLIGEALLFLAADIPDFEDDADTLVTLLTPGPTEERTQFHPVEQALYGGRDLQFGGGFYRPHDSGWNDAADVPRLATLLADLMTTEWTTANLPGDADEVAERLDFARACCADLAALYAAAAIAGQVVVCERIAS